MIESSKKSLCKRSVIPSGPSKSSLNWSVSNAASAISIVPFKVHSLHLILNPCGTSELPREEIFTSKKLGGSIVVSIQDLSMLASWTLEDVGKADEEEGKSLVGLPDRLDSVDTWRF